MTIIVVSPSCTADSAKDLADRMELPHFIKEKDKPFISDAQIINWGCSKIEGGEVILNKPRAVRRSLNKLRTFELLSDKVRMPVMTLDKSVAVGWAEDERKVVCRSLIKGCKSRGITITRSPEVVQEIEAKFYTRFIAGCNEYRINVYKGNVITVYYKQPSNGDFRFKIKNGDELDFQECVQDMIDSVHEHIGLEMFGLDVLQSPKGKWFLLEVNSAPILFPITFKRLAKQIKQDYL